MMRKEYEAPELEIMKFETQDCITASDDTTNIDDLPGGN